MNTNMRILVAEDNFVNRKVLLAFLEQLELTADVAEDGEQVVGLVREGDYDVILMDIRMPGVDGVEATERIRALGDDVHQPFVVAVTASAMMDDNERYRAAGIDAVLTKPLALSQLAGVLENLPKAA